MKVKVRVFFWIEEGRKWNWKFFFLKECRLKWNIPGGNKKRKRRKKKQKKKCRKHECTNLYPKYRYSDTRTLWIVCVLTKKLLFNPPIFIHLKALPCSLLVKVIYKIFIICIQECGCFEWMKSGRWVGVCYICLLLHFFFVCWNSNNNHTSIYLNIFLSCK